MVHGIVLSDNAAQYLALKVSFQVVYIGPYQSSLCPTTYSLWGSLYVSQKAPVDVAIWASANKSHWVSLT